MNNFNHKTNYSKALTPAYKNLNLLPKSNLTEHLNFLNSLHNEMNISNNKFDYSKLRSSSYANINNTGKNTYSWYNKQRNSEKRYEKSPISYKEFDFSTKNETNSVSGFNNVSYTHLTGAKPKYKEFSDDYRRERYSSNTFYKRKSYDCSSFDEDSSNVNFNQEKSETSITKNFMKNQNNNAIKPKVIDSTGSRINFNYRADLEAEYVNPISNPSHKFEKPYDNDQKMKSRQSPETGDLANEVSKNTSNKLKEEKFSKDHEITKIDPQNEQSRDSFSRPRQPNGSMTNLQSEKSAELKGDLSQLNIKNEYSEKTQKRIKAYEQERTQKNSKTSIKETSSNLIKERKTFEHYIKNNTTKDPGSHDRVVDLKNRMDRYFHDNNKNQSSTQGFFKNESMSNDFRNIDTKDLTEKNAENIYAYNLYQNDKEKADKQYHENPSNIYLKEGADEIDNLPNFYEQFQTSLNKKNLKGYNVLNENVKPQTNNYIAPDTQNQKEASNFPDDKNPSNFSYQKNAYNKKDETQTGSFLKGKNREFFDEASFEKNPNAKTKIEKSYSQQVLKNYESRWSSKHSFLKNTGDFEENNEKSIESSTLHKNYLKKQPKNFERKDQANSLYIPRSEISVSENKNNNKKDFQRKNFLENSNFSEKNFKNAENDNSNIINKTDSSIIDITFPRTETSLTRDESKKDEIRARSKYNFEENKQNVSQTSQTSHLINPNKQFQEKSDQIRKNTIPEKKTDQSEESEYLLLKKRFDNLSNKERSPNSHNANDYSTYKKKDQLKSQESLKNKEVGFENLNNLTIVESIKQFKYLEKSQQNFKLTQYIASSVIQYGISRKAKQCLTLSNVLPKEELMQDKLTIYDKKRKTIVLDLDETLIHSETYEFHKNYDLVIDVKYQDNNHTSNSQKIGVCLRPYCRNFINNLAKKFEVIAFTASIEEYANKVIDFLDPNGNIFSHRLFRNHCMLFEKHYIKDLRVLNRPLEDVIIIDNIIYSFSLHLDNGIPVATWINEPTDKELVKQEEVLSGLKNHNNTKEYIKHSLRLNCFYNFLYRSSTGLRSLT